MMSTGIVHLCVCVCVCVCVCTCVCVRGGRKMIRQLWVKMGHCKDRRKSDVSYNIYLDISATDGHHILQIWRDGFMGDALE